MRLEKIEKNNLVYISYDEFKTLTCREVIDKKLVDFVLDERTKAIGQRSFKHQNINSIIVPKNLEMILDFAFFNANIVEILIPNDVLLGHSCFQCSVINNIFLNTTSVSEKCFESATVKNIKLKNTKTIDIESFCRAEITKIIFPDTLEIIKKNAFSCAAFRENVLELPKNLKTIEANAFSNVSGLKKIILPENLEYLSPSFLDSKKVKIVCDEETISRFPFLTLMNTEIIGIDYFLKQHMTFKEINAAYNRAQER